MDLGILSDALVELLRPALPFLLSQGEKAAEAASKKIGEAAWTRAKDVWQKLRPKVEGKEAAREAAEDVAEAPEDDLNGAILSKQLKKLLTADADLAGELSSLVIVGDGATLQQVTASDSATVAQGEGATAAREVAIGGDNKGKIIVINAAAGVPDVEELRRLLDEPDDAELEAATRRYLEILVEQHRYLELKGFGISDRVPLGLPLLEMFVPLKARIEMPEGETWARQLKIAGRVPTEEEQEAMGERLSEPLPVLELLRQNDGLIILGDPGAGKTTFIKFLALVLATGQGDRLGLGDLFPVLLPLSAYAEALENGDVPIPEFIESYYQNRELLVPLRPMLTRALEGGRALLLFDGLDEVKALERRHLVVDRVKDFYCTHRKAGNKLILSSRIVGYREVRPEAEGLAECTLVDFDEEEIGEFVDKWTLALERAASGATATSEREAAREKEELLLAVRHNPGVRTLASNPLLLTILALMKRQGVVLPERRVELYEKYVETLLKNWNLARGLDRRNARALDVLETLRVLAPLALWMHETSAGRGLVKHADLENELREIFAERGEKNPDGAALELLRDVRDHSAFLLDRGGRQYGFIHLTFQEYLAGVALAQRSQLSLDPVVEALASHVGEDAWHEVSLLTIGQIGVVQQQDEVASRVLLQLIERSPGKPGEAVTLAGEAVVDVWPGGVTPKCRDRIAAKLLETMGDDAGVQPVQRAAAGRVLGLVGDPRPEVTTVDGMQFCFVPAGPFVMGSGDDDDMAFDQEKPSHELDLPYDYWMARYPVTVAQFLEYLDAIEGDHESASRLRRQPSNWPATGVSWHDAIAFCEWLTSRLRDAGRLPEGYSVILPSEPEWEKAARGGLKIPRAPMVTDSSQLGKLEVLSENPEAARMYPWGREAETNRMNFDDTSISAPNAVGAFPGGVSPYGCEEQSGNVWEWTRNLWGNDFSSIDKRFEYPYNIDNGSEDIKAPGEILRVLRGGSAWRHRRGVRVAYRLRDFPRLRGHDIGFRVALSPFFSDL